MSNTTDIATTNQQTAVAASAPRWTQEQISAASFDVGAAPMSLGSAEVVPLPISTEYWSPENTGDMKRVYVAGIQPADIVDPQTGEAKNLEAVYLLEVTEEGKVNKLLSASRVLVGNIADAIRRNQIVPGTSLTPVQITYLGQTKNRSNSKMSKRWEILPLVVSSPE